MKRIIICLLAVTTFAVAEPPTADRIRELIQPDSREDALEAYRALSKSKRVKSMLPKESRGLVKPCRSLMFLAQYTLPPRQHQRSTQVMSDAGVTQASGRVVWNPVHDSDLGASAATFRRASEMTLAEWNRKNRTPENPHPNPCRMLFDALASSD